MPIEIRYEPGKKMLVGRITGELDVDEFRATLAKISASTEYPPNVPTLWDLRELDFKTIDRELEERLIGIRNAFPDRAHARIAAVVASDLAFGMSRMFQMLSDDPDRVRVFRDARAAEIWLEHGDLE